jgi:hypothetical protein
MWIESAVAQPSSEWTTNLSRSARAGALVVTSWWLRSISMEHVVSPWRLLRSITCMHGGKQASDWRPDATRRRYPCMLPLQSPLYCTRMQARHVSQGASRSPELGANGLTRWPAQHGARVSRPTGRGLVIARRHGTWRAVRTRRTCMSTQNPKSNWWWRAQHNS